MSCPFRLYRLPWAVVVALACLAVVPVPVWAQFETFVTQKLPNETLGIVTGDFNHDGKLDVATIGDYLSIFLGNGDGTFQPAVNYTALGDWIAVADFNNDGNLDLVSANGDNSVSVFLGNGDGTFQPPKISYTTNNCSFVAVGDFNGDHKIDIVALNYLTISVLLGNGDGTFQAPIDNKSFPGNGYWVAVGDFNNDHRLDVAVVGYGYGILLGNGDGTLQNATYSSFPNPIWSVATADFNRDGNLDMVIGEYFGGAVFVFLGNGDGSFQPYVNYPAAGGDGVLAQDFNHDGIVDLLMGFSLLLGNGDGTFRKVGGSSAQ
jgi:WD40 repeat protein